MVWLLGRVVPVGLGSPGGELETGPEKIVVWGLFRNEEATWAPTAKF
jgi:hypothetical protein